MDKELLELASKACGLEESKMRIEFNQWNPLDDDGDALRLAVKLEISIAFGIHATTINCEVYDWAEDEVLIDWQEDGRKDPLAATRRAITRAAAEIGRSMK
jgi:hypothetical protein